MNKKNIKELFRDNKWLALKPLTLNASIKYGYNTKWCTSSQENPITFYKYSNEGILIYIIERKTNIKWAVYWEINEKGRKCEMSWWNASDERLDSMLVSIPEYIMNIIKKELFLESKPNIYYFSEHQKSQYIKLKKQEEKRKKLGYVKDSAHHDWSVYRNEGVWHQSDTTVNYEPHFDVDEAVRKTLEHKYTYEAYMKALKDSTPEVGN